MIRRYDLERSDNYPFPGRVTYVCSGSGTVTVVTGFPVTSATVSFATLPLETQVDDTFSSSSSSSSEGEIFGDTLPRIYVSAYTSTGFVVSYEGIPEDIGYIEFNYLAH